MAFVFIKSNGRHQDPSNPVEVGSYVSDKANVWGVFVDRNYILASDMGQGLKVLQKVGTGLR